jgi:hypothetical protein
MCTLAIPMFPRLAVMGHTAMSMAHDETRQDPPPTTIARLRATAESATGPLVGGVSHALGAAREALPTLPRPSLPGRRVRAVRRRARYPLPSLVDRYPEARRARPVEVGLRTIDVDDIRGTAVGGGDQRGGDFLPLRESRGPNWQGRWQRLRRAHERLVDLPPIDVVKFADGYWVIDGHNRVALALYGGQVGIDASIVELVPRGGRRTEPIGSLATEIEDSRMVRGRVETTSGSSAAPRPALTDGVDATPTPTPTRAPGPGEATPPASGPGDGAS